MAMNGRKIRKCIPGLLGKKHVLAHLGTEKRSAFALQKPAREPLPLL